MKDIKTFIPAFIGVLFVSASRERGFINMNQEIVYFISCSSIQKNKFYSVSFVYVNMICRFYFILMEITKLNFGLKIC